MAKNIVVSIIEIIDDLNSLDFFYDVGSKIIILDKTNDLTKEISTRIIYDLIIEIEIKENEIIAIDHYLDTKFSNEFLAIWDKEIINRGLEYTAKNIKTNIVEDYKQLQLLTPNITQLKDIIKTLYTFQILIKHILRFGKIPTSIWNKNHPEYVSWNNYFTLQPITAGIIDGILDEVVGIPTGIFSLYEISASEAKEKEILDKFFSIDVNTKLIEMYQNEYGFEKNKSEYKAGKTFISSGAMSNDKMGEILK